MKKLKFLLPLLIIALCSLACFLFAACSKDSPMEQLSAPKNLHMENTDVVWDEVENATGYVVYFNYKGHVTRECRYDLSVLTDPATYSIEVFAIGDGERYTDSSRVGFDYEVKQKEVVIPTAKLGYRLLKDKSGYEVLRGNADLRGKIVIPDEYNGLPVKKISYNFLYDNNVLTHNVKTGYGCNTVTTGVRLSENLEEIDYYAFAYCTALKEVVIPESVGTIGYGAFLECINLKKIKLPSSLKKIGAFAFAECESLAEINFNQGLESLGGCAFEGTPWLAKQSEEYVTVNTVNGEALIAYNGDEIVDDIPSQIKHIATGAFTGKGIVSIIIPEGVTLGGSTSYNDKLNGCFSHCDSLKKVVLPESLEILPPCTFFKCPVLDEISIPRGIKEICKDAFGQCNALKELTVSSSLEAVSPDAFGVASNIKVFYEGTLSEWKDAKTNLKNYIDKNVYYYAETIEDVPPDGGNYWHYVDGKPVIWTKEN